jgi:hypothetical protein
VGATNVHLPTLKAMVAASAISRSIAALTIRPISTAAFAAALA